MKKMIFICSILYSLFSFAQTTINGFEYWFDNDVGNKISTSGAPTTILSINSNIATTNLVNGLHIFNFRSWDSNARFSSTITEFFYKNTLTTASNKKIVAYEYWIDNETKVLNSVTPTSILNINTLLNFSTLQDGLHVLNLRCKDDAENWSSITSDFFYKVSGNAINNKKIVAYQFWNDNEFSSATTETVSPTLILNLNKTIDYSGLTDGLHIFNIRFKDDTDKWSSITTDFYFKKSANSITNKNIVEYQYWNDNNFANAVTETVSATEIFNLNKTIDYSSLVDGLHVFNIRFKDDTNRWSSITTDFYYKKSSNSFVDKKIIAYQVWADNDFGGAIMVNLSPSEQIFELNDLLTITTPLVNGLHLINLRFKDDTGNWSAITTDFFIKKAEEISPKNIVKYEYWFNEDYIHAVQTDVSPSSTFTLNTLILPQYLTTRNNIFNMRFKDDSGEWSSIISEAFEDITLGTVDNTLKNVVFYPNPFEENLNIDLGKNYHEITVEVYDFSGKIAYQQKFSNKDLLQLQLRLNSGVYQLILKADDKITSRKIWRR